MSVHAVGTEEEAPTAMVTVRVTKLDGTVVSRSVKVGFYERTAQLGDFVYADGSCSDVYDENRTVVAICFYVDPTDPTLRLGVCPRTIYTGAWGCEIDLSLSSPSNVGIKSSDVIQIQNINVEGNVAPAIANFKDDGQPDGLKQLSSTESLRGGFMVSPIEFGEDIKSGDMVALGMLETYYIIQHRNRILQDEGIDLDVPLAAVDGSETEMQAFKRLLTSANANPGNGYRYYFPAASAAYAYQPLVNADEELADKFKAHNWFLPTPGDLQRIIYIANRGGGDFFDNAKAQGLFPTSGKCHTTGETHPKNCYIANIANGVVDPSYEYHITKKDTSPSVLPFVAF